MDIFVSLAADGTHSLAWPGGSVRCAVGRAGIRADKREGDGGTPVGAFALRRVLYRADRLPPPVTGLPLSIIQPDDGWCDDPSHPDYNRPVKLPFAASHEQMWLDSAVYDIVVVLGHNDDPPVPGLGSAVFLHLTGPEYGGTAGCVALLLPDLLRLLAAAGPDDRLVVRDPALGGATCGPASKPGAGCWW